LKNTFIASNFSPLDGRPVNVLSPGGALSRSAWWRSRASLHSVGMICVQQLIKERHRPRAQTKVILGPGGEASSLTKEAATTQPTSQFARPNSFRNSLARSGSRLDRPRVTARIQSINNSSLCIAPSSAEYRFGAHTSDTWFRNLCSLSRSSRTQSAGRVTPNTQEYARRLPMQMQILMTDPSHPR
jgi:hypothetical protein